MRLDRPDDRQPAQEHEDKARTPGVHRPAVGCPQPLISKDGTEPEAECHRCTLGSPVVPTIIGPQGPGSQENLRNQASPIRESIRKFKPSPKRAFSGLPLADSRTSRNTSRIPFREAVPKSTTRNLGVGFEFILYAAISEISYRRRPGAGYGLSGCARDSGCANGFRRTNGSPSSRRCRSAMLEEAHTLSGRETAIRLHLMTGLKLTCDTGIIGTAAICRNVLLPLWLCVTQE